MQKVLMLSQENILFEPAKGCKIAKSTYKVGYA